MIFKNIGYKIFELNIKKEFKIKLCVDIIHINIVDMFVVKILGIYVNDGKKKWEKGWITFDVILVNYFMYL